MAQLKNYYEAFLASHTSGFCSLSTLSANPYYMLHTLVKNCYAAA